MSDDVCSILVTIVSAFIVSGILIGITTIIGVGLLSNIITGIILTIVILSGFVIISFIIDMIKEKIC